MKTFLFIFLPLAVLYVIISLIGNIIYKRRSKKYDKSIRNFLSGKDKWIIFLFILPIFTSAQTDTSIQYKEVTIGIIDPVTNKVTYETRFVPIAQKSKRGFDVNSGTNTGEKFFCDGKNFDIYQTATGGKYVKAISSKGNEYPIWIGDEVAMIYEENEKVYQVYKSGTGKYSIFKLNKYGYPYRISLGTLQKNK